MELFEFIMDLIAAYLIFVLILAILQIVAWWRIFSKAGEAGWKSIIPIYNVIVLFKICGLSPLCIFIYFAPIIPIIGALIVFIFNIYQLHLLSKSFGKSDAFTVGLFFLGPIFQLILGFGSAEYQGPAGNMTSSN